MQTKVPQPNDGSGSDAQTKTKETTPQVQLPLNPEMLYLARTSLGFTQTQMAEKLEVTQSRLSRIEDGLITESSADVFEKLSTATGFPVEFFLQPGARSPLREAFFRRKATVSVGQLRQTESVINIQRLAVENLLGKNDIVPELPLPQLEPDAFEGGAVEIARHLRYAWRIPPGPIKNLTELVEMAGVLVHYVDFPTPSVDGVTVWMSGGTPLVLLNPRFPAVKLRMTLAHELGHIIMHRLPSSDMEDQAFAFGAEFLMPERDISHSLYPLDLDSLITLKLRWKTSMQAILTHAKRIGKIKEGYYKFMMIKLSQKGWRKFEPEDDRINKEVPTTVQELVDMHRDELGYSDQELLRTAKIPAFMAGPVFTRAPGLRVV